MKKYLAAAALVWAIGMGTITMANGRGNYGYGPGPGYGDCGGVRYCENGFFSGQTKIDIHTSFQGIYSRLMRTPPYTPIKLPIKLRR